MVRYFDTVMFRQWGTMLKKNRPIAHAAGLLGVLLLVMAAEFTLEISGSVFDPLDKRLHYQAGRVVGGLMFCMMYAGMLARILILPSRGLHRFLFWMAPIIAGFLTLSVAAAFIAGVAKEVFDLGGFGQVEWEDVLWTMRGATTMIPPGALVMAITPLFVTLESLAAAPSQKGNGTGVRHLDAYVEASKAVTGLETAPTVLLVEDDITCATVMLNFCQAVGLPCRHVRCVQDAREILSLHAKSIRVLLVDNFVGVGTDGVSVTGTQWLQELDQSHPRDTRRFVTAIVTGHIDLIGASCADLVLKKPWNPRELIAFLKQRGISITRGNQA